MIIPEYELCKEYAKNRKFVSLSLENETGGREKLFSLSKFYVMIEICALASGSNGNAYYIGNEKEAVLIDVGIFYKLLSERMESAGLDIGKIKAGFISHEHTDHVAGARVTSKKLGIPMFYTKKTIHKCYNRNKADNFGLFKPEVEYEIGDIKVYPFPKQHDAVEPCSFRVSVNGINVGVMTDIGVADQTVIEEFSKCDIVFLETNYDEEMLIKGIYPYYLKQRVLSDTGHLSNMQAKELVEKHASERLSTLYMSHISAMNNDINIIKETFKPLSKKYNIKIAPRNTHSEVIRF
jgi:phosphoribosyl 1,2-cyclic phosphodiesterase